MAMLVREPGTYRTRAGSLIHLRPAPDGRLVLLAESNLRGEAAVIDELVKLSDDPNWPDIEPITPDPELFAD